ncbi:MAG: YraN family protein [Chitinophagales bacterium]
MTLIDTQHIIFILKKQQTTKIGQIGEEKACRYLINKGYSILYTNWRHKRLEVDIICTDTNNTLVFVEVKTRSSKIFGEPQDFVNESKQRNLINAAEAYCHEFNHQGEIRFDIIGLLMTNKSIKEIKHYCDAFYEME